MDQGTRAGNQPETGLFEGALASYYAVSVFLITGQIVLSTSNKTRDWVSNFGLPGQACFPPTAPILASHIYQKQHREYLSKLQERLLSSTLGNALESQIHLSKKRRHLLILYFQLSALCTTISIFSRTMFSLSNSHELSTRDWARSLHLCWITMDSDVFNNFISQPLKWIEILSCLFCEN